MIVTLIVSIGGTGKKTFASKIGGERSLFFCHELGAQQIVCFKFKNLSNKYPGTIWVFFFALYSFTNDIRTDSLL